MGDFILLEDGRSLSEKVCQCYLPPVMRKIARFSTPLSSQKVGIAEFDGNSVKPQFSIIWYISIYPFSVTHQVKKLFRGEAENK